MRQLRGWSRLREQRRIHSGIHSPQVGVGGGGWGEGGGRHLGQPSAPPQVQRRKCTSGRTRRVPEGGVKGLRKRGQRSRRFSVATLG